MPRKPRCCQLCNWEGRPAGHGVPLAVAKIAGLRICAKHEKLLRSIAKSAGVRLSDVERFAA